MNTHKKCGICREAKPIEQFPKRYGRSNPNLLKYACKKCDNFKKKLHKRSSLKEYIRRKLRGLRKTAEPLGVLISDEQFDALRQQLLDLALDTPNCPYTKEPLKMRVNLHLDHKLPMSRYPKECLSFKNLQWVSETYNHAKWTLTDEEFNTKYILKLRPHNGTQRNTERGPELSKNARLFLGKQPLSPQRFHT